MTSLSRIATPFALLALLALVGAGCANNSKDESAATAGTDKGADAPIAGKPIDGPQHTANLDGELPADAKPYTVEVVAAEGQVGEQGQVKISVIPSESWHVNLEYPNTGIKLEVPAGIEVPKAEQGKADALALTEEKCEFGVDYTASEAGAKTFTGEVKFAVCQDMACVPKTETVTFELAVK